VEKNADDYLLEVLNDSMQIYDEIEKLFVQIGEYESGFKNACNKNN